MAAARLFPDEDRKRLGRLLTERRIQINPAYRNRQRFVTERGLNYRLVSDIEKARRVDFSDSTFIALELAYGWATGSITRVLSGGEPEPIPGPGPRTRLGHQLAERRRQRNESWRDPRVFAHDNSIDAAAVLALEHGERVSFTDAELEGFARGYGISVTGLESAIDAGELPPGTTGATDPSEARLLQLYRAGSDYQKGVIMTVAEQVMAPQQPAARTGTTG